MKNFIRIVSLSLGTMFLAVFAANATIVDSGTGVRSGATAYVTSATNMVLSAVTVASSTKTLTKADCGKTFVFESTSGAYNLTYNLPKATVGCTMRFINIPGTQVLNINPNDADYMMYTGHTVTVAHSIQSTTALAAVEIIAFSGTQWIAISSLGTWTDGS